MYRMMGKLYKSKKVCDIVVDELGVAGGGLARVGDQGLDVLGDCVVGGRGAAVGGREALQLALQAVHVQVVVLL